MGSRGLLLHGHLWIDVSGSWLLQPFVSMFDVLGLGFALNPFLRRQRSRALGLGDELCAILHHCGFWV